MSTETITRTDPEQVTDLLASPVAPLNRSATGYGGKIPTRYQIRYSGRLHRVYAMVYGNGAALYIISRGQDLHLDLDTEQALQELSESGLSEKTIRQAGPLTIGDKSADGLLQIVDTSWAADGSMHVTVRELIGGFQGWALPERLVIERMRRHARKAAALRPETIKSSRLVRKFYAESCHYATFAIVKHPAVAEGL